MKIKLITFMHSENGQQLKLLPENEIERELLIGFGKHGKLYFQDDGLRIEWPFKNDADEKLRE